MWASLGQTPLANALEHLAILAKEATQLPAVFSISEVAAAYTDRGWQADLAVLDALAAVDTKVAACAVMAGWLPQYFPVLLSALSVLNEETNIVHAISASTSSPVPVLVVNGPIRQQIGINCGHGLFGPGARANTTIGRALRLVFINGFDARVGTLDRGTMGDPGKFSLCIGEDEENSPWEPFHLERGFNREESTVTVASGHAPLTINSRHGTTAESVLLSFADTMRCAAMAIGWPCQWFLVIGPGNESRMASPASAPEDIMILAAGGSGGRYSSIISLAMFPARIQKIELPNR